MPIAGADSRDIQLQWVADDPAAVDPVEKTETVWSGSSTAAGRTYPLTFNRIYLPGGSSPTTGYLSTVGDLPIRPKLRIYGPITQPQINIEPASNIIAIQVALLAALTIGAGHYVDVSVADRTAWLDGDPSQSVIASVNWAQSVWGSSRRTSSTISACSARRRRGSPRSTPPGTTGISRDDLSDPGRTGPLAAHVAPPSVR